VRPGSTVSGRRPMRDAPVSTAPPLARAFAGYLAIALGCAALLAVIVALTRDPIAANRAAQQVEALVWLTGDPTLAQAHDDADGVRPLCDGTVLVRGTAAGFAGAIRFLLVADVTREPPVLRRMLVYRHQETPGIAGFLADRAHPWLEALGGRDAAALAGTDAVAGATITSRALARALAGALGEAALRAECPP
jgi:Na+-translocating ferredoxin:NAD+ oxidoreductase RnfG subunit